MTLITSISGIRGTIGGTVGKGLTPDDVVMFTAAYANWILSSMQTKKVVIGRDARISGEMVAALVSNTLLAMGIDVVDLGLSTTPTVEIAVVEEKAGGGIIITASHNPKQWNALKLLNHKGEFISNEVGKDILKVAENKDYEYSSIEALGKYIQKTDYIQKHIDKILSLSLVDVDVIKAADFSIVIDCVNSTGGISLPPLLKALGVNKVHELHCSPDGKFPHNPEPLPENLSLLASEVKIQKADLGIVVDPDVDRLAFVKDDGEFFGEEYTLVAVADYVLQNTKGSCVSNLSSSLALKDVAEKHDCPYFASAVGEVNVVRKMKEEKAVIGGEGNGGVIYPELHYGRDALVGIALFLTYLAKTGKSASHLRGQYPNYYISKNKIELTENKNLDSILNEIQLKYKNYPLTLIDGVKIEFDKDWVHLRKSNTEPIIRIYSESKSQTASENLAKKLIADIKELYQ
ncbi:MAG: phosphoglucosamine mutase [Bacteroidetes bacterium]|nr:phosphoglucosamine mutase [Bacteroidota bacterium]